MNLHDSTHLLFEFLQIQSFERITSKHLIIVVIVVIIVTIVTIVQSVTSSMSCSLDGFFLLTGKSLMK